VPDRVQLVRLKDVDLDLAAAVRAGTIPYYEAVKTGLFKPLGQGDLRIDDLLQQLEGTGYQGWYVLEQDVILSQEPASGTGPVHDAKLSIDYLEQIGANGLAA
jgi:inosose dehydratase